MTFTQISSNDFQIIRSLLLLAPKERRLDLAVAAVLYPPQKEYVQVVIDQSRQRVPVWYFFDPARKYRSFFYTTGPRAWNPRLPIALTSRGQHEPAPVPGYSRNPAACLELKAWLGRNHTSYTLSCQSRELQVTLSRESDGAMLTVDAPRPDSGGEIEVQLCPLFARAAIALFAPSLLPLLESDEAASAPRPRSFFDWVPACPTQEIILVPVFVPRSSFERRCQHQEYDLDTGIWHSCQQKWREEKDGYQPEQCPCCGGYYCAKHFSQLELWLDTSEGCSADPGRERRRVEVCQTCALLPEEDLQRLRETRHQLNAKV